MRKITGKTKKLIRSRSRKLTAMQLLNVFLPALTELYAADKTAPGVVLSFIPKSKLNMNILIRKPIPTSPGLYYASIVRYESVAGEGKQILFSAYGRTQEEAIGDLVEAWRNGTPHVRNLRRALNSQSFADHLDEFGD